MKKHWITLSIVAVIIFGAVTAAFFSSRPQGNAVMESISMTATQMTERGVSPQSTFELKSGYSVTDESLRGMLDTAPPIAYELKGSGKNWTITPAGPLEKNRVYTFSLKNPAGEVVQSFAFQTESDLMINTVYPENKATYVAPEAGIEMTFNATGVDLSNHFEIKPEVAGTFEATDYKVIFKPTAPLAPDSIYRVTIKQGLTAPNGMVLTEDYSFSFETTAQDDGNWDYMQLRLMGKYSETFLTGDPLAIQMSSGSDVTGQTFDIKMHRFAEINGYMETVKAHDAFYKERYGKKTEFVTDTTGLEEVVTFNGELFKKDESWSGLFAILPDNLPEGHYVVTISGENAEGDAQLVQKLIQIRNLSVYTQSVGGDSLIWLNDPATGEAVADRTIHLTDTEKAENTTELTTQADGTARVMTREMQEAYLSVMEGTAVTYFEKVSLAKSEEAPLSEKFYAGIYTDRKIYQPDDTIRFWGVLKPRRVTASIPDAVYAVLSSSWDTDSKVYSMKVNVNPDGTFEGTMPISGLQKNGYSLLISDGEKGVYVRESLEIGEYTKPPYVITVDTDKDYYYANEPINFRISASYFDGTPVAGGKLSLSSGQLSPQGGDGIIILDAAGKSSITMTYSAEDTGKRLPSWQPQSLWYSISNVDTEDVQIQTSGTVMALPSRNMAKVESNKPSEITIHTAQLDPSKLNQGASARPLMIYDNEFDRLKGASVDLPLTVQVNKVEYIQTPIGSYYDYVNKKTITQYRSERKETVVDTIQTKTTGGKVILSDLPYENTAQAYYSFEVRFAGGILGDVQENFTYFNRYNFMGASDRKEYSFAKRDTERVKAALGEEITLGLYENNIKVENKGKVLYSIAQRQTLTSGIFTEDQKIVNMEEDFLPNVYFTGAYFDGRHVYAMSTHTVSYNYDSKLLKIDVAADKQAYKPGETANISLTVTDADGKPVQGTACVGIVDESVFSLAQQDVNFADQIYQSVYMPNIQQTVSYMEYDVDKVVLNTGGGGGDESTALRQDFVDTALFKSVQTDAAGKATVTLTLPDNVTSWRITAVAVTDDLKAGDNLTNAVATLPFYLRPLFTSSYLEGDDVALSLDSVGTEIKAGDAVEYTVTIHDTNGTEIDKLTAAGKAGERTPFNFGKYAAGVYSMTATGKTDKYTDAVKQEFSVMKQGITVPVIKNMPLSEVGKLTSVRYPIKLTIYDERMQPYMTTLQKLSAQNGERTELMAANYRARVIYNDLLAPEEREVIRRDSRLDAISAEDGGVRLLPLSESDAAVTAKMLIAAPDLINALSAEGYLQGVLKDPAATPDDRVMAYMGLAALKKPVLLDILRMEQDTTLTAAQRLYLGVGLAKLGDFTGAQKIYDALGDQLITEGKLKYVEGGGTTEARLQNTAAALMLTSVISNPDADALASYFNELDTDRAKNDKVVYNLELLTYVENYTLPKGADGAKFSYVLDGQTQEVSLGELGAKPMSMSYEAMQTADFKVLSGKVYAAAAYVDYARNVEIPANSKVKIEKTYTPESGTIKTTDQVKVELKITFAEDAPSGCYNVTDYIPSGMRYIPSAGKNMTPYTEWYWSNVENEGQRVLGYIYRSKDTQPPAPLADGMAISEDTRPAVPRVDSMITSNEKVIPDTEPTDDADQDTYTITYYVSASLAGEFVTESAYVTSFTNGIAGKSERGTITIQ